MNVAQDRFDDYLDNIDRAEDSNILVATLIEVAARRGFTVRVSASSLHLESAATSTSYAAASYIGTPVTAEVITDLITFFENTEDHEELMNIYSTDLFKYLAGDMIGQKTVYLTIASVTIERMNSGGGGGEKAKPCLHFKERDKLMVLNKTNASLLAKELGAETDDWPGATVTIAAPVIEAFGKSTRSLKILSAVPRHVAAKPRDGKAAEQPTAQDALFGDEYDARQEELKAAALATAQNS